MANRRLPTLRVAEPCSVAWSALGGDGRVRYCDVCKKDVYDLSSFSSDETDALLARGPICGRIPQRASAPPAALAAAAAIVAVAATACGEPPPHPRTIETVKIEQPAPRPTATGTPTASATGGALGVAPPPAPKHRKSTKPTSTDPELHITGLVESDQTL